MILALSLQIFAALFIFMNNLTNLMNRFNESNPGLIRRKNLINVWGNFFFSLSQGQLYLMSLLAEEIIPINLNSTFLHFSTQNQQCFSKSFRQVKKSVNCGSVESAQCLYMHNIQYTYTSNITVLNISWKRADRFSILGLLKSFQ